MPRLHVYWKSRTFDSEQQQPVDVPTLQTGVLMLDDDASEEDVPVIVEDETERIYTPGELPPGTVVYVEASPGPLPALAERAREAGFHVRPAEVGEGETDRR